MGKPDRDLTACTLVDVLCCCFRETGFVLYSKPSEAKLDYKLELDDVYPIILLVNLF